MIAYVWVMAPGRRSNPIGTEPAEADRSVRVEERLSRQKFRDQCRYAFLSAVLVAAREIETGLACPV